MPTTHASLSASRTAETRGFFAAVMAFLDKRAVSEAKTRSYVPFGL